MPLAEPHSGCPARLDPSRPSEKRPGEEVVKEESKSEESYGEIKSLGQSQDRSSSRKRRTQERSLNSGLLIH